MNIKPSYLVVALLLIGLIFNSFFIVDERERAVCVAIW